MFEYLGSDFLMQSATSSDSLVGVFNYKPFDAKVDWSMVAKASPCYVTVSFIFIRYVLFKEIDFDLIRCLFSVSEELHRSNYKLF